ncbi:hypothetical protein FE257_005479 [Aspergillus nanangensis]|uniref:GABA permease n=1 Tax=Aspergillus nanangensis TaxID=2582783 RepID=A0AAD4CR60_ASPNN|nr:hypothetical protein FE257_005479 [Aspergillus nanangensis]
MPSQHVFETATDEDLTLEKLGYHQKFKRSYSLLDMIGFSFSIVTCWTALSGVFIVGVNAGGPPVMIFGWIGVCVVTMAIALSMAEMCSKWPVAGGQYSWVALLAPPRISRPLSYITGWFMLTGILAMGAVNNFITSNFILGQANLVFPSFTIERWHTVLVAWLVALVALGVNLSAPHLLNRLTRFILFWNIGSFVIPASFVFQDFQNFTGWGSSMAVIIGILQSFFGMCCYDAASHMTEEMTHASRDAPRAIIMSVGLGAVTGLVFLIALCFCIGNIDETAASSTGVPVIQIFYDSTHSKVGACFLASLMTVICLFASISLLTEGSRSLYAFARDHGLPFSRTLATVHKKRKVPVYAILVSIIVQIALSAIYFGTVTGFETVISIATTGFYVSYSLPLLSRLLGYVSGHMTTSFDSPYSLPIPISLALNAVGLVFLLFASITFNFPSDYPVTHESMNYTSAAIGVIGLLSLVTWATTGRKRFTGPLDVRGLLVDGVSPEVEADFNCSPSNMTEKVK